MRGEVQSLDCTLRTNKDDILVVCPELGIQLWYAASDLEAELHYSLYWRIVNSQIRRFNCHSFIDSVFFTAFRTEYKASVLVLHFLYYNDWCAVVLFHLFFSHICLCFITDSPCVLSMSHRETNRRAGTHFTPLSWHAFRSLFKSRPKLSQKVIVAWFFRLPGI